MISIQDLHKGYGGVPALAGVSLDLAPGEVHALMGENGAGKSTLIRVLAGVTGADRGRVALDGRALPLASAADAHRAGFRFVHQELNLVPTLSVAENLLLGHPLPRRAGLLVDWPEANRRAADALARFGAPHIRPRARAASLGTGDRLLLRLASLLVADGPPPRLFVLDEPTAALTHAESQRLFAILRRLRAEGAAILYVSHRLDEVLALADRVTVLRDGRVALAAPIAATGREGLIRAMTGQDAPEAPGARAAPPAGPVVARLRGAAAGRIAGLDLDLRGGEILGLAGLEGAGQSDLLRLLLGDLRLLGGEGSLDGRPLPRSPHEAWRRGVAYVPRERRREGLMLGRGVTPNTVLPHLSKLFPHALARPRREAREARRLAEALRLRFRDLSHPVRNLSGGNQQKVVLARATLSPPRLLLLDEPTRGVDVGARADIHAAVRRLADEGCAAVVASTDLPELLALSDRILVLRGGRAADPVPAAGLDAPALLSLVYGEAADGAARGAA